jgi:hypothetical protein
MKLAFFLAFSLGVKFGVLQQEERLRVCESRVVRRILMCDGGRSREMQEILQQIILT